jgi:hypothetical protein
MNTIEKLKELIAIQGQNGNWDYDPYMHGMYNGMVIALSVLDGKEPEFREAPARWLSPHYKEGVK